MSLTLDGAFQEDVTVFGSLVGLEKFLHTARKVYPTLADGVVCAKNNAKWVLGGITEIVPVNTITSDYYIVGLQIENATVVGRWEMVLYYGANDVECARVRTWAISAVGIAHALDIRSPLIPANSRIKLQLAEDFVGAGTVTFSLVYQLA